MIYLDYASATPVSKKAKQAMEPYFTDHFFNPSSPYLPAKRVREAYEDAKSRLAHTIGAKGDDLVITSGATEANNLAFSAYDRVTIRCVNEYDLSDRFPSALVLETEHASILNYGPVFSMKKIRVDSNGLIDLKHFQKLLRDNDVAFISIALANNETGVIQPFADIARIVKEIKDERLENEDPLPLYLHSDASQAMNLVNLSVARLGVDLLTINSAKVYGPKGVGALYVGHQVQLHPSSHGGGQERGLRAGTENVPGLMGFSAAAEEARAHSNSTRKHYEKLVEILKTELKKANIEPVFLGDRKTQLANFCPVSFPGLDAERLIFKLEEDEIYLSTGAACSANKGTQSHVLKAMGLSDQEISGSLRISLGLDNTEEDMKIAGEKIVKAVNAEAERLAQAE